MKIGILSMQKVYNYGSFLQSYALKKTLEKMKHNVSFIDIECSDKVVSKQIKSQKSKLLKKVKFIDKYILRRIQYSKKNMQLKQIFCDMQLKYLNITENICTSNNCDAVVIGSDEIFNCDTNSKWGITGQRFGNIPGVPVVFSYAASCGYTQVTDVSDEDSKVIICSALQQLKGISVRDSNTASFVSFFTKTQPEFNLDPVLIYDFKDELIIGKNEGVPIQPYMVVYAYHNRIDDKNEISIIKKYAKKHNLKTIAIGGSLPWCDEFAVISPFQVLAYFHNANCIVTDTFHGTVIAAKYNKPLAILVRGSNMFKLEDLIQRINISSHRVGDISEIENILDMTDDYEQCNRIIKYEQEHAYTYLNSMISGCR